MREDLVRSAYRVLLGREPEDDSVVGNLVTGAKDPEEVLRAFVGCPEFRARYKTFRDTIADGFAAPRLPIETDVEPVVLDQLFSRIKDQWNELGEREPYWSVLTGDDYLRANFDPNQTAFWESGRGHAAMVDYLPARNGVFVRRDTCLELGCGVGRVTRFLAERFERVIGVDISPGNLKIAQEHLDQNGITNVMLRLLSEPRDIENLEEFDFFFSLITLQHNPPPVQKFILKRVLRALRRNGCALFQLPTFRANYSFSVGPYLEGPTPLMEMHALPMNVVFSIFDEFGLICKEVVMDNATGAYGSHTFIAHKH
jgi:SAM-dependent methyltransferase